MRFFYGHGRTHMYDRILHYQDQKYLTEIQSDFDAAISEFAAYCNRDGQTIIHNELHDIIIPELE